MRTKANDVLYCGISKCKLEKAEPELNENNMRHLLTFIVERYKIHLRKDVYENSAPWTSNEVLFEYKFTNVRREHDRQTRYLIENISTNDDLTLKEKILNSFLFRAWNNWDTMHDLGGPWKAKAIYDIKLKEVVRPLYKALCQTNPKRKWWSSAYNQGGTKCAWKFQDADKHNRPYKFGDDKKLGDERYPDYEADIPLRVFHVGVWLGRQNIVNRLLKANDQKEAFEVIKSVRGFADFLAYQVFVDLTYIKEFPFSENEFVVAGPGCKKGLDYVFDNFDGLTYEEALFWLRDNLDEYFNVLRDADTPEWNPDKLFCDLPKYDRYMNVMSLENCFCELSKYIRAVEGTGRPKNRYHFVR